MRTTPAARSFAIGVAALGMLGAVAGCSATVAATGSGAGSDGGSGSSAGAGPGSSADTSASYRDGSYRADGSYQAPSGTETITVKLTLADDKVTAVKITRHATDPNAIQYQRMFADGVAAIVVGKDIDTLGVSRVSGSSLTSGGFRAAIEKIKAEAVEP